MFSIDNWENLASELQFDCMAGAGVLGYWTIKNVDISEYRTESWCNNNYEHRIKKTTAKGQTNSE